MRPFAVGSYRTSAPACDEGGIAGAVVAGAGRDPVAWLGVELSPRVVSRGRGIGVGLPKGSLLWCSDDLTLPPVVIWMAPGNVVLASGPRDLALGDEGFAPLNF